MCGLGVVGLATGVGLGVSASGQHQRAVADLAMGVDLATADQQRALGQALVANVAYSVGAAMVAAGLLWLIAHARSSE
jgi:hypothetical protein